MRFKKRRFLDTAGTGHCGEPGLLPPGHRTDEMWTRSPRGRPGGDPVLGWGRAQVPHQVSFTKQLCTQQLTVPRYNTEHIATFKMRNSREGRREGEIVQSLFLKVNEAEHLSSYR